MKRFILLTILTPILFLGAISSQAAVDYFLKIEGVDGESEFQLDPTALPIASYGLEISRSDDPATGAVILSGLKIKLDASKASPTLMLRCATGTQIPSATLYVKREEESHAYLKITFTDLVITSYQTGGSSSAVVPTEQLSLNYERIVYIYTDADGSETKTEMSSTAGR